MRRSFAEAPTMRAEEVIRTFEAVRRTIPYEIGKRRTGDVAVCYADPTLAKESMGWKATRSLTQTCADHWHWQSKDPDGYLPPGVPPPPIARSAPTGGYARDHAANG